VILGTDIPYATFRQNIGGEGTGIYDTSSGCFPQFYDHVQHSSERVKNNNRNKCAHLHVMVFIITASNFWNCLSLVKKEMFSKVLSICMTGE